MLGDVAGKGVRAGDGMAAAADILRSVARRGYNPARVLRSPIRACIATSDASF